MNPASPTPTAQGPHTPLPWIAVNRGTDKEPMWSVMAARIAGRKPGHEVAICATGDSPQVMETANCHLIVLAVNSHARLTAENERLRKTLETARDELAMHGEWLSASRIESDSFKGAVFAVNQGLS